MPTQAAYALWAQDYPPRPHNPVMEIEQRVVAPLIAAVSSRRALDVGTGTGRYLPVLAETRARTIVGLDLSMAMLARHEGGTPRVCGDACRLPFADGAFDLVVSSLMVGDIEHLDDWVREAARVLAPAGHLIYSDFHPSWAFEGWRRTFRAPDGQEVELDYWPHAIEAHLEAIERASLDVRTVREPRHAERPSPIVVAFDTVKRAAPPGARRR